MDERIRFSPISAVERALVEELLDRSFGEDRLLRTASRIRAGATRIETASFAATLGSLLVGSVECWQLEWRAGGRMQPLAMLGPLAIDPERRGQSIGKTLLRMAVAEFDRLGLPAMLIGDAPYYGPFGFHDRGTAEWILPGPVDRRRLLLRAPLPDRFAGPAILSATPLAATAAAAGSA